MLHNAVESTKKRWWHIYTSLLHIILGIHLYTHNLYLYIWCLGIFQFLNKVLFKNTYLHICICAITHAIAFKFLAINFHKICLALHMYPCMYTIHLKDYEKRVYNFIILYTHRLKSYSAKRSISAMMMGWECRIIMVRCVYSKDFPQQI